MSAEKAILHIEDDLTDQEVAKRYLGRGQAIQFHIRSVGTLTEGIEKLQSETFDAILLDLNLPDSSGHATFDAVRSICQLVPIIVMTGGGDEEEGARMVRRGAHDYLVKGQFDAHLLGRCVRYATERAELIRQRDEARVLEREAREREIYERERRALAEVALPSKGDGVKGGSGSLSEAAPHYFAEIVARYDELLDIAIERRIYKDLQSKVSERLRTLGRELSDRRIGPRDLVELHTVAVERKLAEALPARHRAYIEEGRLLLVELMGYVIAYYRDPSKDPKLTSSG